MIEDRVIGQGSSTPGPRPVRNRTAQQEVSGRPASEDSSAAPHRPHYRLHHPPSPPHLLEKLSSTKLVLGAKKIGDRWYRIIIVSFKLFREPISLGTPEYPVDICTLKWHCEEYSGQKTLSRASV